MVDLEILKRKGVTDKNLRAIFSKSKEERDPKVNNLIDRIRSRINEGINFNITNYNTYHALDLAWDTPFRQISPTLLSQIIGKDTNDANVLKMAQDWGLTSMMSTREVKDPKSNKSTFLVDAPVFFNVFVPLVRSYVTIRWAKIVNDRMLQPFFRFEPLISSAENRLKCEVITDRIERMNIQMGYFDDVKQAIFQMLHYSICLQFPMEEWYTEEQTFRDGDDGKKEKTKIVKEGIRYHFPHPCRTFYDQAHRPSSFNTDTGCAYAGYWRIVRYRDLKNNKALWNTDKISFGATNWFNAAPLFFQTVYTGCVMKMPTAPIPSANQVGGAMDREEGPNNGMYGSNLEDSGVTTTEYWERLVPKDEGLGDYEGPVWFRFIIASDDTVCYCAPVPYSPIIYYGYDAHEGRSTNASLSLEVLPFQDQVSNLLSQILLTSKQNLANFTFVDTDMVNDEDIKKLESWGEKIFRAFNFVRFSGKKFAIARTQTERAFISHKFPQTSTGELIQAIKVVLDILERVLVMSSQEVAQSASHEQTREEVRNIASTTSTRLRFTATPVDHALEAMKKQLYEGLMAYGEAEMYAAVSAGVTQSMTKEAIEKLGFTVEHEPDKQGDKMIVKSKNSTAILLDSFSSGGDGPDRSQDAQMAASMAQLFVGALNHPMLAPAIGVQQSLDLLNVIFGMSGFPRDFKLKDFTEDNQKIIDQQNEEQNKAFTEALKKLQNEMAGAMQAQMQQSEAARQQMATQLQEVIVQAVQESQKQTMEAVGKAITPIAEQVRATQEGLAQQGKIIQDISKIISQIPQPMPPPVNPGVMPNDPIPTQPPPAS